MASHHLRIGFARRGYSSSGGAETYLKRLAHGVVDAGHAVKLFTTAAWPKSEWPCGELIALRGDSPLRFANELAAVEGATACDVLMSLERVWQCDIYRAGDGVHRAWLDRRAKLTARWRRVGHALSPKHLGILRLEQALFGRGSAGRVIANSHMVKNEITEIYRYPAALIDVVRNGVPAGLFDTNAETRAAARAELHLTTDNVAVLFVGSGWERKGLRFAIQAIDACALPGMRLLVAGKGNAAPFQPANVQFLGPVRDLKPIYAAADIFLLPTIYDPFSNACLEALAAGLPVITTRGNGFAEIMRDGVDGTIIDTPDDVVAACAALRVWSDAAQRDGTQAQRRELATRYGMTANVERTLEILLQAANAASTSGKIRNT